jgi:hypothetical protein
MFNEELLKNHLVSAHFTNSDRTWIEVLTNEVKGSLTPYHIEYDENHSLFQLLSKFVTVDQLHENTYARNEEARKEFEKSSLEIAVKAGLVQTDETSPTRVLDYIFNKKESEDEMFALKIALFEIDEIKDSKDVKAKKAMRKSKTKLELLKSAIDLYSAEL